MSYRPLGRQARAWRDGRSDAEVVIAVADRGPDREPRRAAVQRELVENPIYLLRIGLDSDPWGDDLAVPDPFGNRVIFHMPRPTPVKVDRDP